MFNLTVMLNNAVIMPKERWKFQPMDYRVLRKSIKYLYNVFLDGHCLVKGKLSVHILIARDTTWSFGWLKDPFLHNFYK